MNKILNKKIKMKKNCNQKKTINLKKQYLFIWIKKIKKNL